MKTITYLFLFITGFAFAQPAINTPPPLQMCDYNNDGFEAWDLTLNMSIITNNDPALWVTYYETLTDSQTMSNPIANPTSYVNITPNTTIYVTVVDVNDPGNPAHTSFDLVLLPAPIVNTPPNMTQVDIPYDGHAVFDLTSQNAIITSETNVSIAYFLTLTDAQNWTNEIANPAAYTNTSNPETIYAKVENVTTGCGSIVSFQLILTNPDIIYIPDPIFKGELANGYIAYDSSYNPIALDTNNDGEIQVTEAFPVYRIDPLGSSITSYEGIQSFPNLRYLYLPTGNTTALDLSGLSNLEVANCEYNQLTSLNVSNCTSLKNLYCEYNQLSVLNVTNCPALETVFCGGNHISTLDLTGKPNLNNVWCEQNQISSLDVTGSPLLQYLSCRNNNLSSLDLTHNTALTDLNCGANLMTTLDISHCTNLTSFHCAALPVSTLDFTGLNNISNLNVRYTNITSLNVSNMPNLSQLYCDGIAIPELDLSHNPLLCTLLCSGSNTLNYLNLKNGNSSCNFATNFVITNNPNLQFVCTDDGEADYFQTYFSNMGSPAVVNSYCTFTPGGNFNTISGNITFDGNNNGCDAGDAPQPYIKINIDDNTNTGATFTTTTGNYSFYTQDGTFTISPEIENPAWFTFSPASASIPFANNNNNTATQNFCLAPNGIHRDVEMVIQPLTPARPGFNAVYKLVYKNKGNQTSDVYLNFSYDDALMDFVSSSSTPTLATSGHLSWTVLSLQPFQSGSVLVTLHLNSPTDTPPANIGDVLTFTSFIDITTDENWNDNAFTIDQTVIGSYDPNAIICLEGDSLPTSEIGKYLHYSVTFENTGNYTAENVVVKDVIDPIKYDINSLQVLGTSHPSYIKITGNTVEFIFQNINLAAASGGPPVGGHGDVLFKIKSKDNLVNGDYVSKSAKIYFDYNAPITTNDAQTTFAMLNNPIHEFDNSVKVYPNPAHTIINISCNATIQSISLYDIQGRLLETDLANSDKATFDISDKLKGVYFIKITSEKGSKVEKIMKE